ncbi:hypothetical protein [Paenibacillus dokdonensis]
MDGSTLGARLNGLAKGFANRSSIIEEVEGWELPELERERIIEMLKVIRW